MGERVLVTGGAGFIGSALVQHLNDSGRDVVVLDNLLPQVHGTNPRPDRLLPKGIKFIRGDVTNRADLERALTGVTSIVHLAAETGTGQSMYEVYRYADVNVGGTALLLDVLANRPHSVERVVVASSRSVYGEGKYLSANNQTVYPSARPLEQLSAGRFEVEDAQGNVLTSLPTDENSHLHPSSVYGITKQTQEQLVLTVCPTLGIAPVALRYQNVFGPGQSLSNPYTGILSIFSTLIRQGRPVNVFEDGLESRDFVFVQDVVAATAAALGGRADGLAVNVGSGVATSVLEVVSALSDSLDLPCQHSVTGQFRVGDIRHNVADISLAKTVLEFDPQWTFRQGIKAFATWALSQDLQDGGYERSLDEMRGKNLLK